jgi:glycosyltransferase A (GT-A) superfamily protein (DUF2064 family)
MYKVPSTALILVYKPPRIGIGKQRIAKTTTARFAFDVAKRLCQCALEDLTHWNGARILAPSEAHPDSMGGIDQTDFDLIIPQGSGTLGQRIMEIDAQVRDWGATKNVYIGMDCPQLSPEAYQWLWDTLQSNNYCFIRAQDGGVVAMAAAKPWPDISQLAWSQDTLGDTLIAACQAESGSTCCCYPLTLNDIDTEADVTRLLIQLKSDNRPARRELLSFVAESSLRHSH